MPSISRILKYCLFWFTIIHTPLIGQVPYIKAVSVNSGAPQQTITIQGINFGTNAANIKVHFGTISVVPQTITDQLIEVQVPNGAAYDNIAVTNTVTGLVGYSRSPFLLSFGGTNPFNPAQIAGQFDFDSESGLYDFAEADFDGDGKIDMVSANDNSLNVDFYLNTSTAGTISFTKTVLTPGANTFHVFAGDLNGDDKPEILISEKNGPRVFIYKNNSTVGTPSFALQILNIAGSKVSQVKAKDLDLNGKADLVVTDQSAGRVFVVSNTSTLATIQFSAPISISLTGSLGIDGVEIGDLNNDGLPEIVAAEFLTPSGNISIIQNASSPGSLVFNTPQLVQAATTISNLKIGDLDGDGLPDLAATALLGSGVLIYRNTSTSTIQLAAPVLFDANSRPWGLDFGDADGDGKTDILVASITQKAITILNNLSTSGNFNFSKITVNTTYINRFPKIADLDGDGRPDLAFTSIDDNNLGIPASKISIYRNVNCVVPKLTPSTGPITVCTGFTQRLTASANLGGNYQWFKDNIAQGAPAATSFFDVAATGSYTVALVNGSCNQTSAAVQVNVVSASSVPTATPNPVTPVCLGGTLNLSVNNVGATDYVWTGPGSYVAHGVSVSRTSFLASQAGKYSVDVMVGTCIIQQASIVVDVVDVPGIQVVSSGADLICQGQTKSLSLFPSVTGFSFQWAEQTAGNIGGALSSSYSAGSTGSYFIKLTSIANPSCPVIQSAAKAVKVVAVPTVDFTMPATGCVGQAVNFKDQSTIDPDPTLNVVYAWDFGGAGTGSGSTTSFAFPSANTYGVQLTVSYNQTCSASKTKFLTVQAVPTVSITTPSGLFSFCPTDSLKLQVPAGFDTYLWSNGNTSNSIYVKLQATFSVDVTQGGCKVSDSKSIFQFPSPIVSVTATPQTVLKGSGSQLEATGLTSYTWTPVTALSDPAIPNPISTPTETTNYSVTGTDANGCKGSGQIAVIVILDHAVNSLIPTNFFSPNGDTINDTWQVENAPSQNQCTVAIFDERGLKVFEAKPYLNNWNGVSTRGSVLPAGVYYYVIKCDDSPSDFKAGSINIVR